MEGQAGSQGQVASFCVMSAGNYTSISNFCKSKQFCALVAPHL
jgi:hypothetical protein